MSDTEAPPAPAAAAPEPPVEAAPAPPPEPVPAPEPAIEADVEPAPRAARRRGVPIEPLVIGVGNGSAMAATAAYQTAGPAGLAGAAATVVALAAGSALQRRRTVHTRTTAAAGRTRSGAGSANRGRTRGGASGGAGWGGTSGRSGAGRRGASLGAGSGGRGGASPRSSGRRSALGSLGGRGAGRLKSPRLPTPTSAGKHKRPKRGGTSPSTSSTRKRTPRTRSRLGWIRPAASAARRGMAGAGRGIKSAARGAGRAGRFLAAPVRAAWKRSAPLRRAAARHARKIGGALVDGALAGLVGLAAGLWQRSWRAGLAGVRAMWRRRKQTRAAKRAASGPTMTGPAVASTPPPVATFVRRPASAGGSPSTYGGHTMSGGHHFLAGAMELERVATTYTPEGMMQVGRDFGSLSDALEHVANAMKISTARAHAEQPLDPRIIEIMQGIYRLQMKASELARELPGAFRKLHHVDIERLQNQRTGEREWDVRANADTSL